MTAPQLRLGPSGPPYPIQLDQFLNLFQTVNKFGAETVYVAPLALELIANAQDVEGAHVSLPAVPVPPEGYRWRANVHLTMPVALVGDATYEQVAWYIQLMRRQGAGAYSIVNAASGRINAEHTVPYVGEDAVAQMFTVALHSYWDPPTQPSTFGVDFEVWWRASVGDLSSAGGPTPNGGVGGAYDLSAWYSLTPV